MTDDAILAGYRRAIERVGRPVTFRRISGEAPRTAFFDAEVRAVIRDYQPTQAVDSSARNEQITQGLRHIIVLASDLEAKHFPLPIRKNDKVLAGDLEFNVSEIDPLKREIAGAMEVTAFGV